MLLLFLGYAGGVVAPTTPVNYDTYLHGTVRTTGALVTTTSTPPR
jgi:hypothetical protein